jgi:hypothetical protein
VARAHIVRIFDAEISVSVTQAMKDEVTALAKARGESVADVVRAAVAAYLAPPPAQPGTAGE